MSDDQMKIPEGIEAFYVLHSSDGLKSGYHKQEGRHVLPVMKTQCASPIKLTNGVNLDCLTIEDAPVPDNRCREYRVERIEKMVVYHYREI